MKRIIPFSKGISKLTGKFADRKSSRRVINIVVKQYEKKKDFDLDKFLVPKKGYKTLNEWFTRKLKDKSIFKNKPSNYLLAPCESYMKVYRNIDINHVVQAKKRKYIISELIDDEYYGDKYSGGTLIVFRLEPWNYHRYHYIDEGSIISQRNISGILNPVNKLGMKRVRKLYSTNYRVVTFMKTKRFGDVTCVEVGALNVGSIINHKIKNKQKNFKLGEEKGYFKFGGSTIIYLFERGKINIEKKFSDTERLVFAGEKIGKKR